MTVSVYQKQLSPFLGPKVCKDLVAFLLHLAVDAVDGRLLDQRLQSAAVEVHTRTRADDGKKKTTD